MKKFLGIVGLFATVGLSSGCAIEGLFNQGDEAPAPTLVPPPAPPATTRGYLGTPRTLKVKAGSRAELMAKRSLGDDLELPADLPIVDGELTFHARVDGRLVVDALTLSLGSIHLSPAMVPPDGINLEDVTARLENAMPDAVRWTDDDSAANADGNVRVLLDWSLRAKDGQIYPLATQKIENVPMTLDVIRDRGGKLIAVIHAERDGVFWAWTDLLELSDLRVEVEAGQ